MTGLFAGAVDLFGAEEVPGFFVGVEFAVLAVVFAVGG
jgi:hypothetical protein